MTIEFVYSESNLHDMCNYIRADSRDYHPQHLPDLQVTGVVLQRFPAVDRKEAALPGGIELVRKHVCNNCTSCLCDCVLNCVLCELARHN